MDKSTRMVRRSVKQSNDKRTIVNNIDVRRSDSRSDGHVNENITSVLDGTEMRDGQKTKVDVTILSVDDYSNSNLSSGDSIEKKLDDFINRVQDESVRANCFKKLDDHVNNLLDTFKIREKKRKNSKTSPETNGLDKIDLTTSDSILTQINLKNVFNINTFTSLPLYYQYKLIKLLPKCDQEETPEGWLNLNTSALNNEYFTKAYRHWLKQLKESKLNSDFVQKCKADLEKERAKLDPFKVENFEPIWSEPLHSRRNYDEILEIERQNKLRVKRARTEANRMKNDTKMTNFDSPINQTKVRPSRKRTPKLTNRSTQIKTLNTPITDTPLHSSSAIKTSPLSIGSITVRKSVNSSPPILTNDQSPTNNKLFYISNNGKLLQIQADLQNESQIENNHVLTNHIDTSIATNHLNSYLSATCECQQKALVNCSLCRSFCHQDCVNPLNICDNCQ